MQMVPALAGIKVLELSHAVPAAYCGRQFALWGADVVVAEPDEGSPLRRMRPLAEGASGQCHSLLWAYVAANKRALRRSALVDRDAWNDLLARTDVLIVDQDAAGIAETGMTWTELRERHPHLCLITITAFGLSGPYRAYRGSELVVQALSGYLALNGLPALPPLRAPGHLLAYAVGVNAFVGALAAYLKRERTGFGELVEVSELESLAAIVPFLRVQYLRDDKIREGGCEPGIRLLPCADGWVSLMVPTDASGRELCREILDIPLDAWPEHLPHEHLARIAAVHRFVSQYTKKKPVDEIFHGLERRGITCGKLITPGGLLYNEQLVARQFFQPLQHPDLGALPFAGPAGKPRHAVTAPLHCAPELDQAIGPAQLTWEPVRLERRGSRDQLPLAGLRVLDLTQAWIGPFATLMLADLGADVVKIESHKRPDVWRQPSPLPVAIANIRAERVNRSHYFNSVNRNKRSLTLDLSTAEGRDVFVNLIGGADVIAENFSSSVMARWGLDYDALSRAKPELVMISSSGFGKTGPWAAYKTNGAAIEALAGWDAMHAYPGGDPLLMGFYQADAISGYQLAALTLICLVARLRTGRGDAVDAAMLEAASGYIGELILEAHHMGDMPACGNRDPDMAPHGVFPCQGYDRWIAIAVPDDATWRALLAVEGCPAVLASPELATFCQRLARQDALEAQLANWTREWEADVLMGMLQAANVPAGVVRGTLEAVDEPQLTARAWFKVMTHPDVGTHKYNGFPWRFADCELIAHTPPPRLGEHAEQLLKELLGLNAEQIELLRSKGITGTVL